MAIADIVTEYILNLLRQDNGCTEIQRNELASMLGCVPSQISYVITSRFTPEQGYIVESRRGGGGGIRITRVSTDRNSALMHIINNIGDSLDASSARIILNNLQDNSLLKEGSTMIMKAALTEQAFTRIPRQYHNFLRATLFKNMLLTQI